MAFSKPYYQWRPHPWHGLEVGPNPPEEVNAYIEITPYDPVKYEIDKVTGYLRVDRPQRNSSLPPTLYGFIPKTYCGRRVGNLCEKAEHGDGDPLDICVVSERPIGKSELILSAKIVGGFQVLDHGEADDKIIGVLSNDNFWGNVNDLDELPEALVNRLSHYFRTYKLAPGQDDKISVEMVYHRERAQKVIQAAMEDYREALEE